MVGHRHYVVSGRVQGVGFRAFTEKRGQALGLIGRVRNLRDGRVEIVAIGNVSILAEFEAQIAKGPLLARVDDVKIVHLEGPAQIFEGLTEFVREKDGEETWRFG